MDLCVLAAVILQLVSSSDAIMSLPPLPDPLSRANQTLQGMFEYYWMTDPQHQNISFFFACGQMGGWGNTAWNKCSCRNPSSCTDCYRWWDAVALESMANFGLLTGTQAHSDIPEEIFAHSPYNGNWPSEDGTYIDDFGWFGIAYLRVHDWLKNSTWLVRSIALFDWGWKNGWDNAAADCGGFLWCTYPNQRFKDSITFLEFMHIGAKLAFMFPNETRYLQTTERIWNWFFSFDNGRGLFSDNNLVSTGAIPFNCCNSTTSDPFRKCYNSKMPGTSYNQGIFLSTSAYLYRSTKNIMYLNAGLKLLDAILANYTTQDGILIDEPRSYQTYNSYQCLGTTSDPGGDWYSFQGIMMIHLSYFAELLMETNDLTSETFQKIKSLITVTSNSAWVKSAVWPPFTKVHDACNTNSPRINSTFPKFHWWWNKNNTQQKMPPDPQLFFHKTQLRCFGNNTQLWKGGVSDENTCKAKCMSDPKCSKYQYNQYGQLRSNCWLWPFNRTNHICDGMDGGFNVGFKRPVGNATCAGKCGSQAPQTVAHGMCYCDDNCSVYHDCCLDYADMCQPNKPISCTGMCNTVGTKPLVGGGYCWCFDGCNPWFSDNNSDGSCCLDYQEVCNNVTMPTCLDARSQGSVLNLFLAHRRINDIKI